MFCAGGFNLWYFEVHLYPFSCIRGVLTPFHTIPVAADFVLFSTFVSFWPSVFCVSSISSFENYCTVTLTLTLRNFVISGPFSCLCASFCVSGFDTCLVRMVMSW